MEQNTVQLESLIEKLMEGIKARGLAPDSQKNYTAVCNSIRRYQKNSQEVDVSSLLDKYLEDFRLGGRRGKGKPSPFYLRFTTFIVGLLRIILETGEFVFAKHISHQRYLVSEEEMVLIKSILEAASLEGKAWIAMEIVLRHFFSWLREKGVSPEDTNDEILMEFIINVVPETNSGSIGVAMRGMRYLSAYFRANGIGNIRNDISFLQVRTNREGIIKPFSRDEIEIILSVIDRSTDGGKRDYAIIMLAVDTGLRAVDVANIKLNDIDWKKEALSIVQSKTGKRVSLPLSGMTMNALADYILTGRPESEYKEVFLSIYKPARPICDNLSQIVKKYSNKAGLSWISRRSFHSLRRTFATEMASAGVEITTISQMLGHSSINEDKPYITYDKRNITSCAFNFNLVPIRNGIYRGTFSSEGGAL